MERIEKKFRAVMVKVNHRLVKQIEIEMKRVYEHYIADYYYYTPRRYERQDNLWYGLKVIKHKRGDDIYDVLKIRISGVYFPRKYENKINPDTVMDMVLEGNRRPYWFSSVDSKNFGRHVVKYSGDNYGNQILGTRKGLTFDDMMESAMKKQTAKMSDYIVKYFNKYWRETNV